jgi:tetratricopeptide (TPR) repeat protein
MPEKGLREVPHALRERYDKAVAAIQKNNLDYALALLEQLLQAEPGFYDAREALRAAQFRKAGGRGTLLKRVFGTASASPLLAKAQLTLRGNPLEALRTAEQVLGGDPGNAAAHRIVAAAALAADLPRTAVLSLEILFKNNPDREVALQLGSALARAGQVERAETMLGELAQTFPNDTEIAQALKNLSARRTLSEGGYEALADGKGSYRDILANKAEAVSLEQEKREVKAEDLAGKLLEEYEVRLAKEPKDLRLVRAAAELHSQRGHHDQALAYYQRIVDTEGVADPSLERAVTETTLRRYDAQLEAVDAGTPEGVAAREQIRTERQAYELERARQLVEKYPSDLQLHFDLGVLYFKSDRITEAIQELQKAQNNPHRRIAALTCLGQCFARRGILDLAARTFRNALKEKPVFDEEKKDLLYQLGTVLDSMGKPEDAIEAFKEIYEVDIGYRDVGQKVDAFYARGGGSAA